MLKDPNYDNYWNYSSDTLQFSEHPNPILEIHSPVTGRTVCINELEDAIAVRDSLNRFIDYWES